MSTTSDDAARTEFLAKAPAYLLETCGHYPGMADICSRADELNKITPHLVPSPCGGGFIGSSDPRWIAIYEAARALEKSW